jgi:hypothetical protein
MVLLRFFEILKEVFYYRFLSVCLSSVAVAIYTQDHCLQIFSLYISGKVKEDLLSSLEFASNCGEVPECLF